MYARFGKRCLDLTVVILALPVWFPALILLALLVRIQLGSPVFFRQTRPGHYAKPFRIIKFRSMTDERDREGNLLPDAQRLTRFGHFLRASSLDELPELWNVLRGEMSLVGPRPLTMEYLPLYSPEQARRHEVPPGITGWAQINGRNQTTWEDRFAHDLWYREHQSLWLDLKILFLTLFRVLRRDGIAAEGHATMPPFRGSPPPDQSPPDP